MSLRYTEILKEFFQAEKVGDYSLKNTEDACRHFGNPERAFRAIHIAGTNGKGSVSKMVFQILRDAGKKVGIYTSPHLIDICERFETENGRISEDDFVKYASMIIEYGGNLSYFERCAVLAFLYFRDQGSEFGVIEVGLGGRLDATNVIMPLISVITGIGYDHMEFLGDTLEKIAFEKGGIIKSGVPVILYGRNPTLEQIARSRESRVIFPKREQIATNLIGQYQESNARIAFEVGKYIGIDESIIQDALLHVHHPGRMQYLYPNLLIDGAHNEQGLRMLKEYIESVRHNGKYDEIVLCFNLKSGKSTRLITDIFPHISEWYILEGRNPLVSDTKILKDEMEEQGKIAHILTPRELLKQRNNNKNILYVVFGSLYMVGELIELSKIGD